MASHPSDLVSNPARPSRRAWWIVVVAMLLFAGFFGANVWYRQVNLFTSQFDMGNMDQVLWHTIHGQFFQMTSPNQAFLQSRTAIHADFLLLMYTPFYAIWSDPRVMSILQVLAVTSGAIPLFWIAAKKLGSWPAALFSVAYLLYPPTQYAITFDVHAVVLVIPIILWAWWALEKKSWWLYGILATLAILSKEESGLLIAMIGVWWIWKKEYHWVSIASIVVGIGWTVLMVGWAIPHARQWPGHFALSYYADFGTSYTQIIKNIIAHPTKAWASFFGSDGLDLFKKLLLPLAALPLLGIPIFLLSISELAVNLLSNNPNQHTIFYQYTAGIIPFVFLGAVYGWMWTRHWVNQRSWGKKNVDAIIATLVLACSLYSAYQWALLPGTKNFIPSIQPFWHSPYRQDVQAVQKMLKSSDRVVATNNLAPQFSRRNLIWGFPQDLNQADAIIVLEGGQFEQESATAVSADVRKLAANPAYTLVYHHNAFWMFRPTTAVAIDNHLQ